MRKRLKSGLVIALTMVLILSQISMVSFANPGRGNSGKDKDNGQVMMTKIKVSPAQKQELRERLKMMFDLSDGSWAGIPEGLAKLGFLPYGLAKQYMNGNFPYGLAKRIRDFKFPKEEDEISVDWKLFDALVASAKSLIAGAEATPPQAVYVSGALGNLKLAVAAAEKFKAENEKATAAQIKVQFDLLDAAIKKLKGLEILGSEEVVNLKAILVKLEAYKTKYYTKLKPADQTALVKLIDEIKTYSRDVDPLVLLMKDYQRLVERSKAYEDHLELLKALILEAETLIYINPAADPKVLKDIIGLDPLEYSAEAVKALQDAILIAQNFVDTYSNQKPEVIDAKFDALTKAIQTFELSVNVDLGVVATFKLILNELKVHYETRPSVELDKIIDEMQAIVDNLATVPLTQAVYNTYFDKAEDYIKDLYDGIKKVIASKISDAKAILSSYETTYTEAQKVLLNDVKVALEAKKAAAKAYLAGTSFTYADLKMHNDALVGAIAAFNDKVVEITPVTP